MYEVEVGLKFVRCNFWSHTFSSCCLCMHREPANMCIYDEQGSNHRNS